MDRQVKNEVSFVTFFSLKQYLFFDSILFMKKIIYSLAVIATVITISSCKTLKEIPTEYTAAQIIQMGQDAYDASDYLNAENCFETAFKRYGMDVEVFLEAKYELAHTYLAEKKYEQAYDIFNEILDLYYQTSAGDLPSAYKKLAQIGISQIPENKKTSETVSPVEEE